VAREDGAWILGNVLDYNPMTQSYMVQDEDDVNRVLTMGFHDVRRLDDSSSNLRRGDQVLAVFPETTSFYNAVVVKTPKLQHSSSCLEVVVKFDDDEDENGRNPARRVPARFVLRRSDIEEDGNGDSDDDDG
jgi:SAGA-associated factor 29